MDIDMKIVRQNFMKHHVDAPNLAFNMIGDSFNVSVMCHRRYLAAERQNKERDLARPA